MWDNKKFSAGFEPASFEKLILTRRGVGDAPHGWLFALR
jgi:hypothetical protein